MGIWTLYDAIIDDMGDGKWGWEESVGNVYGYMGEGKGE